jgi:hypothetical protein
MNWTFTFVVDFPSAWDTLIFDLDALTRSRDEEEDYAYHDDRDDNPDDDGDQ